MTHNAMINYYVWMNLWIYLFIYIFISIVLVAVTASTSRCKLQLAHAKLHAVPYNPTIHQSLCFHTFIILHFCSFLHKMQQMMMHLHQVHQSLTWTKLNIMSGRFCRYSNYKLAYQLKTMNYIMCGKLCPTVISPNFVALETWFKLLLA